MTDARARGVAAQQLLDNDLFQHLFATVEQDAIDALASADLSDHGALQRAAADLQAIRRVKGQAESIVTTGTLSQRVPPAVA